MHIIQQPALSNASKFEMNLLGIAQIPEFRDHSPLIFARGPAGDAQFRDLPILTIHPVIEIQTANFAFRPLYVVPDEFAQPGSEDVLRRVVRIVS